MSDLLSRLAPPDGARHSERRVGRGPGCRKGKTCGRGFKGQKARRSGKLHFQGGQTPLQRRLPKRGFRNPFAVDVEVVNVGSLERFASGSLVDLGALRAAGLVSRDCGVVKVLGEGELTRKLDVQVQSFSASAVAKIEAAGGKATVSGDAGGSGDKVE